MAQQPAWEATPIKQSNSSSLSEAVRNEWEEEVFCLLAVPVMGSASHCPSSPSFIPPSLINKRQEESKERD